jgi:hypothetical protein
LNNRGAATRPLKNAGLNGKWKMVNGKGTAKHWRFSIFHLPFTMQDAFFSILRS